jgi:transcriptional regulator with XRE-family HTH domain
LNKRVDGLLSGSQISEIRAKYKVTQAQAAKLFGGGPVAFSKYENDDVAQSAAMDNLLKLVEANESAFWTLVRQKGMQAEFVRTSTQATRSSEGHYLLASAASPGRPHREDLRFTILKNFGPSASSASKRRPIPPVSADVSVGHVALPPRIAGDWL